MLLSTPRMLTLAVSAAGVSDAIVACGSPE